jgi:hypothetical protein
MVEADGFGVGFGGSLNYMFFTKLGAIYLGGLLEYAGLTSVTFEGTIPQYFFHSSAFYWIVDVESGISMEEGDLRAKFYATDPDNGTPGTYTRASGGFVWTKQP